MRALLVLTFIFMWDLSAPGPERPRPRIRAQFFRALTPGILEVHFREKRVVVRLAGIVTPPCEENEFSLRSDRYYGIPSAAMPAHCRAALGELNDLLKRNDTVFLEFEDAPRDRDFAYLCYVYLPDGRMLNEMLVRGGFGFVRGGSRHAKKLEEALADAIAARRGIWAPVR